MKNINFKFLNFCTIYSSKGSINKPKSRAYCFSTIFYQGPNVQENEYMLEIYTDKYKNKDDNNCLLTEEQLITHIEEAKKFRNFEYSLSKKDNKYILNFKLNGPRMYHKVILSWIRYAYEFPFNVALYEAFKLKNTKGFKRESLFNLFNLVGGSMSYYKHGCDIHAIGRFNQFKPKVSYKELKTLTDNKINESPSTPINTILPELKNENFIVLENKNNVFMEGEYWEDNKSFKKRLKVYRVNNKILKKLK